MKFIQSVSAIALLAGVAAASAPLALAQDAGELDTGRESADREVKLDTVIVNAEKRESSAQETPLALSAFSDEDLERVGAYDVQSLQSQVPNLFFSKDGVNSVTQISMRGIGNENASVGGDSGVALHIDGIYYSRPSVAGNVFFDLQGIEVLRGPQGTLFGRNTNGGSVNLITANPTDEFEGKADVTFGNYDRFRFRGVANLPLNDRAALRISGYREVRDGYTEVLNGFSDIDDADNTSLRAKLRLDLSDSVEWVLGASIDKIEGAGPGVKIIGDYADEVVLARDPVTLDPVATLDRLADALPNPSDPRKTRRNLNETRDAEYRTLTSHLTWDAGPVLFKSITGYADSENVAFRDLDTSEINLATIDIAIEGEQWSQEFQLVSDYESPLDWILGAYYITEDSLIDLGVFDGLFGLITNGGEAETESWALFGQANYALTDRLTVTAGARYSYDEKVGSDYLIIPGVVEIFNGGSDDWSNTNYRLGVDYKVSDDSLLYASFARGYKSGGYVVGSFIFAEPTYDPETVNAWEIGSKNRFWNDRVQLNLAGFYYDYKDLQVFKFLANAIAIENAAQATVAGAELELQAYLTDDFRVDGALAYLDAEYDDFMSQDPIFPELGLQDVSGNRLNRAPEFSVSLGAEYEFDLGNHGRLVPRIQTYWQSEVFFRQFALATDRQDSFMKTDLRLSWFSEDETWRVEAFVRNLEDEDTVNNTTYGSPLYGASPQGIYDPPRTVGVTIGVTY